VDVGIPGERLVWRREEITQVPSDPIRLGIGEVLEILLASEDRDCREVAILILDGEVGNETRSLAGILDVPPLQCRADLARRTIQGVAADDRVDWLVIPVLGAGGNGTDARRGEQRGRGGGPGATQGVAP
jgi:hypothetical protein